MLATLSHLLSTLPLYLAFLVTAIVLIALALLVYTAITPYRELALIREGNSAAAISLGGTVIGLSIALFSTAANSTALIDLIVWGIIAVISQLIVFFLVSAGMRGFRAGIEQNRISYGIVLAAFSIAMGIINAGSLTE